ncbi:MAG: HlyD family efflux transporter periplasmic adaptor subunit [Polyangiaceae bacterium]|nr:HlyD family efflux transporter periplasmic adaptor subunit [Polyangiaceae bacterium]
MLDAFSRSKRALENDGHRRSSASLVVVAILAGAWLLWFFLARITQHEVSASARLEVVAEAHRVEAPVAGRVTVVHTKLDAEVVAGEVLVELDADPLRLSLDEKQARLAAVDGEKVPLRAEIEGRRRTLRDASEATRARVAEALAQMKEAEADAKYQETEAQRAERLRKDALITEADAARIDSQATSKRRIAETRALSTTRVRAEGSTRESELAADIARLERDMASLEGQARTLAAEIEKLRADIEMRKIRAPIAGRIGEITTLRAGGFVREGDVVVAIVPPGDLKVVAEFPARAAGRIRKGQTARLRLDAFPWIEYGTLRTVVDRVGTEATAGRIRVELGVERQEGSAIPMEHGLSGEAVIDVEQTSPATLVLRAAGQIVRTERKVN